MTAPPPPPPLLYEVEEIDTSITQVINTYDHDMTHYLVFAEWRTTKSQHPNMRLSQPLNAPKSDWNTYSPNMNHPTGTSRQHINELRNAIRLRPSSMSTSYPLTTGSLNISDIEIIDILVTYNFPPILTIDGSFKPSHALHVYQSHQLQTPTLVHAVASITITAINNSHPT